MFIKLTVLSIKGLANAWRIHALEKITPVSNEMLLSGIWYVIYHVQCYQVRLLTNLL